MSSTTIATTTSASKTAVASLENSDAESRVVRFDKQCVLIPDNLPQKLFITKQLTLPRWKRRGSSTSDDDSDPASPILKVPVPSFLAKRPRSTSRDRTISTPLLPCIVSPGSIARANTSEDVTQNHRHPRSISRQPSLPSISSGKPYETVPLRSCCQTCYSITEECLKEGNEWKENFSRGARRRRSSSVSSDDFSMPQTSSLPPPFSPRACFAITVDEVDKRRKSLEKADEPYPSSPTPTKEKSESPFFPPRASPIQEEDEDQLFPLPSPRRSPGSSPANSLKSSPSPSPNNSKIRLGGLCPRGSPAPSLSGSEDGGLPHSLKRKDRCEKGLLTPEPSAGRRSPSSTSLPETTSTSKPTSITIPPTPSFGRHIRVSSSPGPSSPSSPLQPVHPDRSPSETPSSSRRGRTTSVAKSARDASNSPTTVKRRSPGLFSPASFLKDAFKGVSSIASAPRMGAGF